MKQLSAFYELPNRHVVESYSKTGKPVEFPDTLEFGDPGDKAETGKILTGAALKEVTDMIAEADAQ